MGTFEQTVEARGHLIDSGIMSQILDRIIERKCAFRIESFAIGQTHDLQRITALSDALEQVAESMDTALWSELHEARRQAPRLPDR